MGKVIHFIFERIVRTMYAVGAWQPRRRRLVCVSVLRMEQWYYMFSLCVEWKTHSSLSSMDSESANFVMMVMIVSAGAACMRI